MSAGVDHIQLKKAIVSRGAEPKDAGIIIHQVPLSASSYSLCLFRLQQLSMAHDLGHAEHLKNATLFCGHAF